MRGVNIKIGPNIDKKEACGVYTSLAAAAAIAVIQETKIHIRFTMLQWAFPIAQLSTSNNVATS